MVPILSLSNYYICHIKRNNIYYITAIYNDTEPLFILEVLNNFYNIVSSYFNTTNINENTYKDNFFIINEILNEYVNYGFPLTTEINPLYEMIKPPGNIVNTVISSLTNDSFLTGNLATSLSSKIPWRSPASYVQNEIYFDLFESVDAILSANNNIITAEVYGKLQCTCNLNDTPDLELSFSNANLLVDTQLHKCVRINKFERDKILSFVPPDGVFNLCTYRVDELRQVPIYIKPQVTMSENNGRVYILVSPRFCESKDIEDVVVTLPLPSVTANFAGTCLSGNFKFDDSTKVLTWTVGKVSSSNDKTISLTGSFTMTAPAVEMLVATAQFTVKTFALSGLKIDNLIVHNVKYKPFRGIRSITKAGKYQIRCDS